jgi:hypothetical protein
MHSVILLPIRVGLQFGHSASERLLGLFASLLTWRWGRVAELSDLLDSHMGFDSPLIVLSLDSPVGFRAL